MLKRIFYNILFLLAASQVEAANIVLELIDNSNQEVLAGADVAFKSNAKQVHGMTNAKGQIALNEITWPCMVNINLLGYESIQREIKEQEVIQKEGKFCVIISMKKLKNTFDEIIVTAQSKPILASQSIYKVNTVNNIQIAQRGAVTLSDVLNYELNNFISNDNVLGSAVSIAGIGGQNVKILVNGIPVLGRENGNIDLGQLNLSNVKRVEMIQGPMSVMYGSNALGGVINLITSNPQNNLSINARMYLESIGKYNLSSSINYTKNKHSFRLALARNFFQGWTPTDDSADRFQLWKPKTQYTSDLQYNYQAKRVKWSYFGSFMSEKITNWGLPIINPYEGYALDEYYRTRRLINSVSTVINLTEKSNLTFLNSYSTYHRIKNRFKKDLVTLEQIETTSIGDQDTSIFNNINLRGTYQNASIKKIDFTTGYEFSFDNAKSFKLASNIKPIADLGLFASVLYHGKYFNLQPSFRYTLNNQFGHAFTPALHGKVDLNSKTQLRASYAKGFRSPSLKEMYLQFVDQNHTIIGNEDLKPEIGHHGELGLERSVKLRSGNVLLSANGSVNSINNMITLAIYNGSGVLRKYTNLAEYRNWIFNVKGKLNNKKFSIESGLGFIYVQNTGFIPQHNIIEASLNASYLIKPIKTNLNVNYKFNSKQPVLTVDEKYLFTQPLHIANVSFQKNLFSKALSVQMGVKNLFNLQTSTLNSTTDVQGGGHLSSAGLQMFPARSIFMDIQYIFNK